MIGNRQSSWLARTLAIRARRSRAYSGALAAYHNAKLFVSAEVTVLLKIEPVDTGNLEATPGTDRSRQTYAGVFVEPVGRSQVLPARVRGEILYFGRWRPCLFLRTETPEGARTGATEHQQVTGQRIRIDVQIEENA